MVTVCSFTCLFLHTCSVLELLLLCNMLKISWYWAEVFAWVWKAGLCPASHSLEWKSLLFASFHYKIIVRLRSIGLFSRVVCWHIIDPARYNLFCPLFLSTLLNLIIYSIFQRENPCLLQSLSNTWTQHKVKTVKLFSSLSGLMFRISKNRNVNLK